MNYKLTACAGWYSNEIPVLFHFTLFELYRDDGIIILFSVKTIKFAFEIDIEQEQEQEPELSQEGEL